MSSSPTSSSSSSESTPWPFAGFEDVACHVRVVLGTGYISVRDCLTLAPSAVLRLHETAGSRLSLVVNGVPLGRGDIEVAGDRAAFRLAEVSDGAGEDEDGK